MPNQPRPGYHKQYAAARRAADRRLRNNHPDEWRALFEEERWQREWPTIQQDRGVAEAMAASADPAKTEAEYRYSWIVGQRMMDRPGFRTSLRKKLAELDKKYQKEQA